MCPTRVLGEAGQLLVGAMNDVVPPEAQVHLVNAQRELLLAVTVTIEHHLGRQAAQADRAARRRRPAKVEID